MTLPTDQVGTTSASSVPPQKMLRLSSWKEIASYFDRDIRTVQLWEKNEGLPVHRHGHAARSSVYAYPSELELWLAERRRKREEELPLAPTETAGLQASAPATQPATPLLAGRRSLRFPLSMAAVLAVAAIAFLAFRSLRSKPVPPSGLTVVLADFVNATNEPVFHDALNVALTAKLQQTPFLTLMGGRKIQTALGYMGLPIHTPLTQAVAREVCEREGGDVVLQGSIASIPKGYMVGLQAMQCRSGKVIANEQAPVEFRDSVLDALDRIADAVRPQLGESAASIKKYDVPLDDASTGSLEALTAYSQANQIWNEKGEASAAPYYERAVEIDPNFALAYARLGTIYGNMGESQRSNDALTKAYERRDRITEWERFYVVSHYYGFVTGEIEKEMATYEEWAKAYPHDMAWTVNLAVDYGITGQLDKAIELQRRASQEVPGLSPSYGDLAQSYLAAERPDEARAVLDQVNQRHEMDTNTQLAEYELAFYRDDQAGMDRVAAAAENLPGIGDLLLAQQATTEDRRGRLSAGRALTAKAAAIAARDGNDEVRSNWLAGEAVRQAEMGSPAEARRLLAQALDSPKAATRENLQVLAALAYVQMGDLGPAQRTLDNLVREHPLDTLIQSYWAPILRAHLALDRGQYKEAVHFLDGTGPYDLGIFSPGQCMDAAFVRGQALLADHQGAAAAVEFRSVLAHRGLVLNCPTSALSQLGLARSLAMAGDVSGSISAYQDLLALWKQADPDLPLLHQAQAEYRGLQSFPH